MFLVSILTVVWALALRVGIKRVNFEKKVKTV